MDKKQKIIEATIDQFTTKGVENTKISDIVKAAGIAQGTFYLYFPSKFSVMPEIAKYAVEEIMKEIHASVNLHDAFDNKIEQLVKAVFRITEEKKELFAVLYAGLAQSEHLKQWESIYSPFYNWVYDLLEEAASKMEIRQNVNSARTSRILIGLIESTAEQLYLYDSPSQEEIDAQYDELIVFIKSALK
ncbi:TetR family transcriptional regulator [Lysinibacillus sp. fls2-241-R2A-57]|uniref:TetR family transcriptional regulator n=1 Tax=Lysinibacillus sp. fls2-241-R2A-57 TaxID=3040292 RepID=UPI0025548059|nr:TetR family transcriptional regulator [Lysinibacillus sp. fls2-241-R2A-57]